MKRNEVVKQSKKLLSAVIAASVIASSAVPETLLAADFSDAETTEVDVEDAGANEQNVEVEGEQEPDSDAEVDVEGDDNEEEVTAEDEGISSGDDGVDTFDLSDGTEVQDDFDDGQGDEGIALYASNSVATVSSDRCETITIASSSLNGNTVNGAGESGKKLDQDGGFYSKDYKNTAGYLPDDGEVITTDGIPYQLTWSGEEPYVGNDCIQLVGTKGSSWDSAISSEAKTMTLLSYGAYDKIYVLGTAAGFQDSNSALEFSVTLTYTDDSSSTATYSLYDWYANSSLVDGYAQYRRNDGYTSSGKNPMLQSKAVECDENKLLKSITFKINAKSSLINNKGNIYAGIYAVTGVVADGVPSRPTAIAPAYTEDNKSFTAKWNPVSDVDKYYLDVSEYPEFVDGDGKPSFVVNNAEVNSDINKYTVSNVDLTENKAYYYRVRANNSFGQSISSNVIEVTRHVHSWNYEVNSNVVTATCSAGCRYQTNPLKWTLIAPDTTYSGKAYDEARVRYNSKTRLVNVGDIIYSGMTEAGENYAESTSAPTEAGTYTASVMIGSEEKYVTATKKFKIAKVKERSNASLIMADYDWWTATSMPVPTLTGVSDVESGEIKYYYSSSNSYPEEKKLWDSSISPQDLAVGRYKMYAEIPETANYEECTISTWFYVTGKHMDGITISGVTGEYGIESPYDGQPHGVTVEGELPDRANVVIQYQNSNYYWETPTTDEPVNAGLYSAYIKITAPGYYEWSKSVSLRINPTPVELKWSEEPLIYNGQNQCPTATAMVNEQKLDDCQVVVEVTGGNAYNAGTYTAQAVRLSDAQGYSNYNSNYTLPSETTKAFTIQPKEVKAVIESSHVTYDGIPKTANVSFGNAIPGDDLSATLTYAGKANDGTEVNSTDAPSLAGTYKVKVAIDNENYTLNAASATADFVIDRADPELKLAESIGDTIEKTIGDEAFELGASRNKDAGEISYKSDNNEVATVDTDGKVTIVGAGTAILTISVAETANYAAADQKVTLTVNKHNHKLDVGATEYKKTYGDDSFGIGAKAENNEAKISYKSKNEKVAKVDVNGQVTIVGAGEAKIIVSVAGDSNYNEATCEVTVKVEPKEVGLSWSNTSLTYNGQAQKPTATAEGVLSGDTCDVTVEGAQTKAGKNYTATATKLSNENYKLPEKAKTTFAIDQKEVGLSWSNTSLTYNGQAQKPTVTVTGLIGKDTCDVTLEGAQTEAGKNYTVTATKLSNGNYKLPENAKTTFAINQKEVGLSWSNTSLTYNGQAQKPTATAEGVLSGDTCDVTVEGAQTEAGKNYTATATKLSNGNYKLPENAKTTFTINRREITAVITPNGGTYGGKINPPAVTLQNTVEGEKIAVTLTYTGTANDGTRVSSTEMPTKAGNYTVTASIANENYNLKVEGSFEKFTVSKAAAVAATKEPEVKANVSYTGSDQPLVTAGEVKNGTLMYQVNGGEWTDKIPTVKNAGTYKVSYKIKGDGNHEDSAAKDLTVTVAPKAVTVTADNATKVYGSEDGKLTYTPDGVADGDTLSDIAVSRKAGEDAGTYEITASQKEGANPNYNITFKSGTFTITKAAASTAPVKKPEVKANAIYTGSNQPLVTAGEVTDGTLMYRVNDGEWTDKIPTVKDAGTYKVSYKVVNAKNYVDSEEETLNITVAPKTVTVTADNATKVYGSEDGKLTYTPDGVADGDTLTDITVSRKAGEDAGTYEITASQKEGANPNYSITFNAGTFTITKAAAVAATKEPEVKTNAIYTGSDQTLVTAGEVKNGTLMYQVNGGEWTDKIPTVKNAGTYKVSYKIKGDGNHEDSAVKDLTVTVAPKAVTVTADNAKKYSGKADPKLTYKVSGLAGNDKLSDIVISRKAGENVGSYVITVSQKQGANPNYTITFKNAVFTITQGDQSRLNGNAVSKLRLPILLARGNGAKSAVNLKWLKYSGATGYEVYWSYCDGKQNFKKLVTVANGKLTATHKKLKSNREYKYFVVAYKMVDGNKVYIAKSNSLHVAMKQANKTNAKSVSVKKQNVVLSQGRTFQIKASVKLENKKKKQLSHAAKFRYYVVDSKIATVSKSGKIKAVGKGTTYIYVLANNGAFKTVKVTVK